VRILPSPTDPVAFQSTGSEVPDKPPSPMIVRRTFELRGTVQGVGFRPALYRLARAAGLKGSVQNRRGFVRLVIEGPAADLDRFMLALPERLPAPARIEDVREPDPPRRVRPADAAADFVIEDSGGEGRMEVLIPPDIAVCDACMAEVFDPAARRHGYPFATCAQCGPRYTVVRDMPYDRDRTSMAAFPLCAACRAEYDDPADRRFHAETIACPRCGPTLRAARPDGSPLPGDPLRAARAALARGEIVAVRGIGGFLLAVDAFNPAAIARLRERKRRPHKPLAVMARDLAAIRRCCGAVDDAAAAELQSAARPILILDAGAAPVRPPLEALSPDSDTLGVMLPTSPLHALLFVPLAGDPTPSFELLVMTSGNRRSEPICIANDEAFERLADIADLFLVHDREIELRNDDSLCVLRPDGPQVWRRARGYAPAPLRVSPPLTRAVLAMGAEVKSAIAFGVDDRIVCSPHIGDLETPEALDAIESVAARLPRFLERAPEAVAVDLHPDMHATLLGRRLAAEQGLPVVAVQHHAAHAAACLGEAGLESGLVLAFDGHGLGADGAIWGAELIELCPDGWRRLATFRSAPLPGADAAVRRPARQLVARWTAAGIAAGPAWTAALGLSPDEEAAWAAQAAAGLNTPRTHAAGRVFDAVSAALGTAPGSITYEGQAAVRLETAARRAARATRCPLPSFTAAEVEGLLTIDWSPLFAALHEAGPGGLPAAACAFAFHSAVAEACEVMVQYGLSVSGERTVGLSGGVFMNRLLGDMLENRLRKRGVRVVTHHRTPPNDGCIAYGQAIVAGRSV
jgi:hydrogenase maturation protein HypF